MRIPVGNDGFDALRDSVRRLDENIWVADIAPHRLDDVPCPSRVGRTEDGAEPDDEPASRGRGKRRRASEENV